jgi:hypothetical protein
MHEHSAPAATIMVNVSILFFNNVETRFFGDNIEINNVPLCRNVTLQCHDPICGRFSILTARGAKQL